jgi:signal transduction histidine kinase
VTVRLFRWRPTIRVRLTVLYAGTFFLAGLLLIALIYFQLGQVLHRQLVVVRTPSVSVGSVAESSSAEPRFEGESATFRFDARTLPPAPEGSTPEGLEAPQEMTAVMARLDTGLQRARRGTLNRMLISSIVLLGVFSVVAGVLGWTLAAQSLAPLRSITATARRVADRSLHERIALTGPNDEIKDLADTLDSMLERLDLAFDTQQRFIANASHELRTPLAINRTLLEVALMDAPETDERLRQLGATLLAVNQRHERLIEGLLTLTSSEQHIVDPTPVDLAEIAAHVVSQAAQKAADANLDVRTELKPAETSGEPILLERLVENLVENAIRYNVAEDGWIRVATGVVGEHVELVVENPGPVIPHYDAPRLFEPFQRLSRAQRHADQSGAPSARGAGLGLSIVRSVARAHGGEATATPREGGGLVVRVELPKLSAASDAKPLRLTGL